jgi:hypothetical protein
MVAQAFQPVSAQAKACGYLFLVPKLLLGNVNFSPSSAWEILILRAIC